MPPPLLSPQAPAILALADGTVFQGISIGAAGHTVGEVVFNTALTGYQEILTDPSYCRQIVTLTYPHIGNYGVNDEDVEATQGPRRRPDHQGPAGAGVELPQHARRCREYLRREGTVAIAGIDTRRLTRMLRTKGAQNGCILTLPRRRGGARRRTIAEAIAARAGRAEHGRARPGQGRQRRRAPTTGPRPSGRSAAATARPSGAGASTSSPTTSASSATSCACWPAAAAASRWCRRRRRRPQVLRAEARRHLPEQRPGRPRALRLRDRRDARADRARHPDLRHLPGPPDPGARLGREDLQDEVRPPRREPPGEGPRQRPRQHHQPEPRLRGRREDAAGEPAPDARHRCSTARCRAWRAPTARRSASRATRKPRPGRTTSATCSTASSR